MSPSAERPLLVGLLALQLGLLTEEQFLKSVESWQGEVGGSPAGPRALRPRQVELLDALLEEYVAHNDGDPRRGLATLPVKPELLARLGQGRSRGPGRSSLSEAPAATGQDGGFPAAPPYVPPLAVKGPDRAGRYARVRHHARGGLGEVSVAVDEELDREVALKEIQTQFAHRPEFRERFVREAKVTGRLEHPGIVPVYGMGSHADGRPYYAMRLVKGESLHEAIQAFHKADQAPDRPPGERELALRSLLARFVAVCNAVAYAHSRGVIHRDLKPANVMLGGFGETYVVDWGLAKVMDQPEPDLGPEGAGGPGGPLSTPTAMGQAVGTPAFMPPEQALGQLERVDPRSDVWALGATLYCLLTGRPPYTGDDLVAQAAAGAPAPARQVNRRAPAALEAVCLKAMAPGPEGRYAGARELAADVERWLADEPVGAYREPLGQRLRRWSRRHRTAVAGVVALLAATAVGLGLGLWAVDAERARTADALGESERNRESAVRAEAEARANLRIARKAVDDCFVLATEDPVLRQRSLRKVRRLLLEKALPFYQYFHERGPDDPRVQMAEAQQHVRVAAIQFELGHVADALRHQREAEALTRRLSRVGPAVPVFQTNLASILTTQSDSLRRLGQHPRALAVAQEAVELYQRALRALPAGVTARAGLASSLNTRGRVQDEMGRPKEALADYAEAASLRRALVKSWPDVGEHRQDLARSLTSMGVLKKNQGDLPGALADYTEAAGLRRALAQARPDVPEYRYNLAVTLMNRGVLLRALGEHAKGLLSLTEAIGLLRPLARAQPDVPAYQHLLASSLTNLARVQRALGRPEDARASLTESCELGRELVKEHPANAEHWGDLMNALYNLGNLHRAQGRLGDALACYTESAERGRHLIGLAPHVPAHQQELLETLTNLANLQATRARDREALATFDEARTLGRRLTAVDGAPAHLFSLARLLFNRSFFLSERRRWAEAREGLDESLALLARVAKVQPAYPGLAFQRYLSHRQRARALGALERPRDAVADWDRAVELAPAKGQGRARVDRALCLARAGEHDRAGREVEALARAASMPGPVALDLARAQALAAAGAARDPARPLPLRERLAEARASQAVALLRRAARAGLFRDAALRKELDADADLGALRGRADYQQFRAGLGRPAG